MSDSFLPADRKPFLMGWGGVGRGGVGWGEVGWGSNNVLSLTSMNATLPTSLRTCNYVDECYVANVSKNFQLCGCMRKME